ncbi:MAG: BON domain-containing protein [Methylophilaceae bacterium]
MQITKFNKPLMVLAVIAGTSMNAVAFNVEEVEENQASFAQSFNKLDVNNNGKVTWEEAAQDKSVKQDTFIAADKNGDKVLDKNEYAEMKAKAGKVKVEQVAKDSAITAKAKAALLAEKNLKSLNISVETYKGDVILSGFVSSKEMKEKAGYLVSKVEGVKSVKNALVVKS